MVQYVPELNWVPILTLDFLNAFKDEWHFADGRGKLVAAVDAPVVFSFDLAWLQLQPSPLVSGSDGSVRRQLPVGDGYNYSCQDNGRASSQNRNKCCCPFVCIAPMHFTCSGI